MEYETKHMLNGFDLVKFSDETSDIEVLKDNNLNVADAVFFLPGITDMESEQQAYMIKKDGKLIGGTEIIKNLDDISIDLHLGIIDKYTQIKKQVALMLIDYFGNVYKDRKEIRFYQKNEEGNAFLTESDSFIMGEAYENGETCYTLKNKNYEQVKGK